MFFSMRRLTLCDGKNTDARAKWMTEHLQTHVLKLTSEAIGLSAGIAVVSTIWLFARPHLMRGFSMPSVFSALIAYVVSHCRSHQSLRLENMALRHQLAVYQHTVKRPKLRPVDRLFWSWLVRLW